MAEPGQATVPDSDNPPVAGPGPDAQSDSGHPSLLFSDLLASISWAMAQAHAGDAAALVSGSVSFPAQLYPIADARLPAGINVVVDLNEGKQPVTVTLKFDPSPVTVARLNARALLVAEELKLEWQKRVQA